MTEANAHPVSIITGAGSGIGAATARMLAGRGHACVLVGRSADKLEEVRASLAEPTRHLTMPADVADSGLCFDIVDRTLEAYGRVDALVLAAGTAPKSHGIHAFAVNPGCVDTAILRRNFPEKVIPRERTLPPEAIAEVISACACGERDAESGTVIPVPSP